MSSSDTGLKPANWQITATTLKCDLVNEYVTVMVNKDWSYKCVWWSRNHNNKSKGTAHSCAGPGCQHVIAYRDRLIKEEAIG